MKGCQRMFGIAPINSMNGWPVTRPSFGSPEAGRPILVGTSHRFGSCLAVRQENTFVWFWVGTHDEYERLLRS